MPNVLAMSFEGELAPSFDLKCLHPGMKPPDGWGIGYYPGGENSGTVLKEPVPSEGSIRSELVKVWEHLASSIFVLHVRTARWGHISDANTQPFLRSYAGRDWLFSHSGSMREKLALTDAGRFEPVGTTDTELIFCELLQRIASKGWRSLGDAGVEELRSWFQLLNQHGSLSSILSDGTDLCVYCDEHGEGELFVHEIVPPCDKLEIGDRDLVVHLTRRAPVRRNGIIVSSERLSATRDDGAEVGIRKMLPGELLVFRQGACVRASANATSSTPKKPLVTRHWEKPTHAPVRRFEVVHRTAYRYDEPVEKSFHLFRLCPVHDRTQSLLSHEVTVSVDGQERDYEDVFGNRVKSLHVENPFTELLIEARSRVELRDTDPLSFRPLRQRSTIPPLFMPWQRHVLQPYLLAPELPETQLYELAQYAMGFVERNNRELLDTLLDLNVSIFKEYEYKQGATSLRTTPFDIYETRRGVCQDFANLFICLARLIGVPARYACGYLYTGAKYANTAQADASHAWVQVYLPEVGWKGFDPTNGVMTQTEHVRVAVGRNYGDATPTSGTIYLGGGKKETLTVAVRVVPIDAT